MHTVCAKKTLRSVMWLAAVECHLVDYDEKDFYPISNPIISIKPTLSSKAA